MKTRIAGIRAAVTTKTKMMTSIIRIMRMSVTRGDNIEDDEDDREVGGDMTTTTTIVWKKTRSSRTITAMEIVATEMVTDSEKTGVTTY